MATPLSPNPSECQEISASWTNLADVEERGGIQQQGAVFPRRAELIKSTLELKLAILSGGRDESGREIITFPSRPRAIHYDHTQLLQTLQYLSTIPSPEALELGFALIVDGRSLPWADIKLILRTSQEALPGQVHVAYVLQPTQFVNKKQTSLSLSKEKDKLEFSLIKVSSIEKLLQQLDSGQVTTDLGGAISYKHEEWLELRIKLEELLDIYQSFVERVSELENQLKLHTVCPEKLNEIQNEMSLMSELKTNIERADEDVNRLSSELKLAIESACGSTGMTPERVNSLAKVNKIVQLTSQQCSSLLEQYTEQYRQLDQSNSMKQFELGITKVMHWIKSKGLDEASSLEIGDSLTAVLSLQEKLTKLTTKVESMKEDITELKRMADTMLGSEAFDPERVKNKLSKMASKNTKFMSAYELRINLVSRAVKMYQGLEKWRELYERLTVEWTRVKNETQSEDCDQLLQSLDEDNNTLKELAHSVLKEGQELVKALKDSGVSQGDPEFRRSLRNISRTTDEVTDKARRSQEIALAKYARLDQYSQLLACEKDGRESVQKLKEHLVTLEGRSGVLGETLDATQNYLMELEEHRNEIEHTKEYAKGLLQSALHQRDGLGGDTGLTHSLLTELHDISVQLDHQFTSIEATLHRVEKIQTVYEGTESTISYWTTSKESGLTLEEIDSILSNMNEKGGDLMTAVTLSMKLGTELKSSLLSSSSSSCVDSIEYIDKLLHSLSYQKSRLSSLLSQRKKELTERRHLLALHQSNEEVLLWLREEGLPQLTAFCCLKFSMTDVQEQHTHFTAFKAACDAKTEQIDRLYKQLPQNDTYDSRTLLSAATKRATDLQSIWRRFLLRVENRERVVTSLYQFLNETMKLTSTMTQHLKSASATTDHSIIQSSYDSVLSNGNRLLELLVQSPGGTQDALMVGQIKDRLRQLSDLYKKQFLPFIKETTLESATASSNGLSQLSPLLVIKEKELKRDTKPKEEKKSLDEQWAEDIRREEERRLREKKREEQKKIETERLKEEERRLKEKREEEERKMEEQRQKEEERRLKEKREAEERKMEEQRQKEKEKRLKEKKEAEEKKMAEEKRIKEVNRQKALEEEMKKQEVKRLERKREEERLRKEQEDKKKQEEERKRMEDDQRKLDEEKKRQELMKAEETTKKSSTDFQQLEIATDDLLQKLFKCINNFLKSHNVLPSTVEVAQKELAEHTEFLQSLQSSISELHVMSETLKAHTSYSVKQKVLYLVDRIEGRVKDRVSVVEKRIGAMNMIISLYEMNQQCHKEREALERSLTNPYDPKITSEDARLLLTQYQSNLTGLETLAETYTRETRSFTSISSELETSGVESRKTIRGLLRSFESSLSNCKRSYQHRKVELESVLKRSEESIKVDKLSSWLTNTGLPSVDRVTVLGGSASECALLLEKAEEFEKEVKAMCTEITVINSAVNKLSSSKDSELISTVNKLCEKYKIISEKSSQRLNELCQSHEFFSSAERLLSDLNFALNQETREISLNPLVAENQYSILCVQAKGLIRLSTKNEVNKPTISSTNMLLKTVDDKLSTYLVACENSFEDLELSLSKLDTLLEDIDESVKEELLRATGERQESKESKDIKDTNGVSVRKTKSESGSTSSSSKSQFGSFKTGPNTSNGGNRQRIGSVNELKKIFESSSVQSISVPFVVVKEYNNSRKPTSSLCVHLSDSSSDHTTTLPSPTLPLAAPSLPLTSLPPLTSPSPPLTTSSPSLSSPVFSPSPSPPSSPSLNPPPTPPPPSINIDSNGLVPPVRPPLPIEDHSSESSSPPPTPPPPPSLMEGPLRPPPPPDTPDYLLSEEEEEEEKRGEEKESKEKGEGNEEIEKEKEEIKGEMILDKLKLLDDLINSTNNDDQEEEEEETHQTTPNNSKELLINDKESNTENKDTIIINEEVLVDYVEEEESLVKDEDLLSDLLGEKREEESQYLYPLDGEVQQPSVVPVRILSPVFEDEGDRSDRPDIGWSSYPRRTSNKRMSSDDRAQWAQAHRQSLQSMRSILTSFYNNEVMYSETLKRLVEVYCPILQYTGAYTQIHELVAFQMQFMNRLTASLSNVSTLCNCFQENIDNFKIYFPFVIYYDTSLSALSQCSTEELVVLTSIDTVTNEQLLQDYSSPYYRIETYCNLFQQLLQAAYKEDLMSLAALSETLELLLGVLRKLSTELATTKLHGCPFPIDVSEVIAASPFLVHIANREKEVLLYTAFLHPEAIILADRELDEQMEKTQYIYVMHISTSGLLLIENYHGLADRFAICERNQTSQDNIVVFRTCEDVSIKDYWVRQLQLLLSEQALEMTPQEVLQPEQVELLSQMIPTDAPPPPGPSEKLNPLRHKGKKVKTGRELIDGLENEIEASYSQIHRVVIEHTAPPTGNHGYLTVYEGDLVHVLEQKGLNCLVATIPADSSDEEEEGYVPTCCLEPIDTTEFKLVLNHNNNNNSVSPPPVHSLTTFYDSHAVVYDHKQEEKQQDDNTRSEETLSYATKSLEREWAEFCQATGTREPFPPNCTTEDELLQVKMEFLYRYHSLIEPTVVSGNLEREMSNNELDWGHDEGDGDREGEASPVNSLTNLTERRKLLYQAPFLDNNNTNQEPSNIQLDGVFSLVHPYVAIQSIEATSPYQVSLRSGQFVSVLDSKRDDWWLVSTFPESDEVGSIEGWVNCSLLQHAAYIREETVSQAKPSYTVPLWVVLADYIAEDEGTVSITKGGLVEVIDQSQTQWSLIRTIGRYPAEGWVPSEFIAPYNFSDQGPQSPIIRPTSAGAESSSTEGYFDNNSRTSDPLSPCLSLGELNEEQKREAAEHRDFTLSELLSSEKEYIDRLAYCLSHYKSAIMEEKDTGTVPRSLKASSDELFGNIQEIYDFHKKEILPQLEQYTTNLSDIVDLFALSGPTMKALYVTYCKGKHKSEDIYRDHIDYLQELRDKLKDRLSLRDYLILPIQRITKYNLLLKSLFDLSNKASDPVPHFKSALAVTHDVSRQANNVVHMSLIEGIEKKLDEYGELALQDTFGVCDTSLQRGLFKERQVFLFEKTLLITKRRTEGGSYERETYINKEAFMLQVVSFSEDTDVEKRNIVIYDISTGNKFTLKAGQTKIRDEWLSKARELISIARRPALALLERVGSSGRSRSVSEPLEINVISAPSSRQNSASLAGHLLRQGSQRSRKSARGSRPSSASHSREEKPGTLYVVMECVVLEGGDDCQLEPKEIVELVRVEESGLLRVRTSDGQEGLIPPGFVRKKDAVTEGAMETAPKITVSPPDQTLFPHDRFSVSCAFNGMPPPTVIWKRNDITISNTGDDARVHISSCDTSSVLEIRDLLYSDEGEYNCIVTNPLGSEIATMELTIEGPPSAPSKPMASHGTTTSVKLKWNPPEHDGHYPITSYLVEQLQGGFEDWRPIVQQLKTSFTVKTLEPNTWYQFRIIANNEQGGASEPSPPSDKVFTMKSKGWMSPSTKKKFVIDTEIRDDTSGDLLRSPLAQDEDLSRTSSACVLDSSEVVIRKDSVHLTYDVLPGELGRGQYGIIRRCVNKCNGVVLAAKYLKDSNEASQEVKMLQNVSLSLPSCSHVMELVDAILTEDNLVIITELCSGGELIDWILSKDTLTEDIIVNYMRQLLIALEFIHDKKIVHLDIKPENIMLSSDVTPILKLIDFGSAQELPFVMPTLRPDSIEFSSPEVVFEDHVNKCADLWSVGILTYVLISGVSPFYADSTAVMSQKLSKVQYTFSSPVFHQVSSSSIDFISNLLKKNPLERMTATSALDHKWIKGSQDLEKQQTKLDLTKLKGFHARRQMQILTKAAKTMSIFNPHIPRLSSPEYEGTDLPELPPTFEGGTEEIQAPVGASITLEWEYTGHPEPTVEWERNERLVASSNGGRVHISTGRGMARLSINEVVRSDEGVYTCCLLNNLGSDVRECRLVVIDKPSSPSNITGVLLGSSTSVLVSWLPPVSDGHSPITHYILEACQIETDDWLLVSDKILSLAQIVYDLLPGKSYVFRVASVNAIGPSLFSKPSVPLLVSNDEGSEDSPPCSTPLISELQIRTSDFNLEYQLITEIGSGSFSTVYECLQTTTDRSFAAKFITCTSVEDYQLSAREIEMIRNIKHPRIAFLEDAFKTPTHTIMVLEFVQCGDLHSFITSNGPIDEQKTARFIRHILEGLEYLHNRNIILINIAPDNLTLGLGFHEIKIIDFSYSQYISDDNQLEVLPLNIDYLSPEAVQFCPLTGSTDMWSVGGVALYMLSGHCPFISDSRSGLIANIQSLHVNIACDEVIRRLSPDCSDVLFDGLLTVNPKRRLSSHQCQRHRWLQLGSSATALPRLQHMDTKEQVEYFMRKYPTHFHQFSDPS